MKNILVLVHDDPGQEARLQAALDVTRAVGGHLTCLDVSAVIPINGDVYPPAGGAMLVELERESEAANRARLQPRLAAEDVSWSWLDVTGYVAHALEDAAALADLIVVNASIGNIQQAEIRALASALVVTARKPLLAVPAGATGFDAAGAALVAWDGSREAATALASALPLLQLAKHVTILEVADGSAGEPAEEAAAYLSRHGVHPVIVRKSGDSPADVILDSAFAAPTDYLVMGAFGHSRLVESLFGGVTRRLLKESPVPLLIAH
ncbi:MAG: universal stress protein [Allosphingosinicella sp.]